MMKYNEIMIQHNRLGVVGERYEEVGILRGRVVILFV